MKTIIREYNIFSFDELSQEAKDKARIKFNEEGDMPFLQDDLREYIHEELTARGYTHEGITPLYDLSSCQGSGLMFEGSVTDKQGNTYTMKQRGLYYHERSADISATDKDGEELTAEEVKKWEDEVYVPICKTVRDRGYNEIDYNESEECFAETCEANEYTFLADGTMFNE